MAQFQKAQKVWDWSVKYDFPSMQNKIITIANCDLVAIRALYPSLQGEAWSNGFLKEWKVYSEINSLAEANFSNLTDDLNESERLSAVLNVEWGSPRFHFCIWSSKLSNPSDDPTVGDWNLEGKSSLINAFGYPYRIYYPFDILTNNLAKEFGDGTKFGFSLENVGHGYPITDIEPFDKIIISGNWTQELTVITPDTPATTIYYQQGSGGTGTINPYISGLPQTLLTIIKPVVVFAAKNITPGGYTFNLIKDGTSVYSTTGTAATSTATVNIDFSTITAGNGTYKAALTQGTTTTESEPFLVKFPTAIIQGTSWTKNSTITTRLSGLLSGQTFSYQWEKQSGSTWNNATLGNGTLTYTPTGTNDYYDWAFSMQSMSFYNTYPGTYRCKFFRDNLFTIYSQSILISA